MRDIGDYVARTTKPGAMRISEALIRASVNDAVERVLDAGKRTQA